jgi:hypothetical protein
LALKVTFTYCTSLVIAAMMIWFCWRSICLWDTINWNILLFTFPRPSL